MRSGPTLADTVHQVEPEQRTVLVAPAWPYANGPRHIGHVAGFAVPADVLARFERLRGSRVLMASGTDEHGTPITYEADKQGVPPRDFVDRNNALIVDDLRRLGMKDNITFHTVMWPAILMGAGDPPRPFELPEQIVASEHLHMEGKKLSTSRGQVIYVKDFLDRYDADALRYYL